MMNDGQRWSLAVPALACLFLSAGLALPRRLPRDLTGTWRFRIDRDDRGLADEWWKRPLTGFDTIKLPGMMQAQGFGDEVSVDTIWTGQIVDRSWFTAPEYAKYRQPGNIKVPFWLQPEKHYVGRGVVPARGRDPGGLAGQPVVLTLERPHWRPASGSTAGRRHATTACPRRTSTTWARPSRRASTG